MPLSGPGILSLGSRKPGLTILKSGAFNPTASPGYLDRFRADTLGLANNAGIANWVSVGGTHTFSQATGSAQPTFTTNILNGKGVAHFNGANVQILTGTAIDLGKIHTVYTVVRRGATNQPVVGGNAGTMYALFVDGATGIYYRESGGALMTGTALPLNTWEIHSVVRNGTAVQHYFGTSTAGTPQTLGNNLNSLNINAFGGAGGTGGFTGDIADVILCTAAHSASDRSAMVTYLQTIWGAI